MKTKLGRYIAKGNYTIAGSVFALCAVICFFLPKFFWYVSWIIPFLGILVAIFLHVLFVGVSSLSFVVSISFSILGLKHREDKRYLIPMIALDAAFLVLILGWIVAFTWRTTDGLSEIVRLSSFYDALSTWFAKWPDSIRFS